MRICVVSPTALDIQRRVTFTDFRADVSALVASMDIVVLVTHFERFPLVLLEAMAQRKPVIATAVGGIPELIVDGHAGLLHRHEDPAHLSRLLFSLLNDHALATRLADAGRELVERSVTIERFARGLAHLYRSLLSRS